MFSRIHILGAAGAGKSTLAAALAENLGFAHLDTDHFYWLPTDLPYQAKRPVAQRVALLREAVQQHGNIIISGSLSGWGNDLRALFDAVVWLDTDVELRLKRLRLRQRERNSSSVIPTEAYEQDAFLEWAGQYDSGTQPGRSRSRDMAWIESLSVPVLHLDGSLDLADQVRKVLMWMETDTNAAAT
jgi:adenylate kinase family enzyme